MRTLLFLAADSANIEKTGKLNILGIFNRIYALSFPCTHGSLCLVAKLAADLGEYDTDHTLRILFLDMDGNELGAMDGGLRFGRPENGDDSEVPLIVQLNGLKLPQAGRYDFRLLVNKDLKAVLPIDVVQLVEAEPPAAQTG